MYYRAVKRATEQSKGSLCDILLGYNSRVTLSTQEVPRAFKHPLISKNYGQSCN